MSCSEGCASHCWLFQPCSFQAGAAELLRCRLKFTYIISVRMTCLWFGGCIPKSATKLAPHICCYALKYMRIQHEMTKLNAAIQVRTKSSKFLLQALSPKLCCTVDSSHVYLRSQYYYQQLVHTFPKHDASCDFTKVYLRPF